MQVIKTVIAIEDGLPVEVDIYLEDGKYEYSYCNDELNDHLTSWDDFVHWYGDYGFKNLEAFKKNKRTLFTDLIK